MRGNSARPDLGHILCSWGLAGHSNGDSTAQLGGRCEFTKERDDEVFSAVGDAVLIIEVLIMAYNAPLDLLCLSKLGSLPLPPTLPPRFLGYTGLLAVP